MELDERTKLLEDMLAELTTEHREAIAVIRGLYFEVQFLPVKHPQQSTVRERARALLERNPDRKP